MARNSMSLDAAKRRLEQVKLKCSQQILRWEQIVKEKEKSTIQSRKLERQLRMQQALELRKSGKTFAEIGFILHVSKGRAQQIFIKAEREERFAEYRRRMNKPEAPK